MTNRGLLAAAAALLVGNALILGGVMRNRAGDPDAVVRLSERELESWGSTTEGAQEILNLKLRWNMALGPGENGTWFDRARLEGLGVTDLPAVGDSAVATRGARGTYPGYVVLELAGPAWEHWEAREMALRGSTAPVDSREATPADGMLAPVAEIAGSRGSRLMAVDIGHDPQALRTQYPDRSRYLILPATYQAQIARKMVGSVSTVDSVNGRVSELLPGTVHVPRPLRDSLLALGATKRDSTTRFEVTVKVGKRWEVWAE